MRVHEQILDAARRLSDTSVDGTFTPVDIVQALPHLNESTVRTHVVSRCCVNAPQNHGSRHLYFRRVNHGVYKIEPEFRSKEGETSIAPSATPFEGEVSATPSISVSVDALQEALRGEMYVADRGLAMSVYLALQLGRPLFLEGEAGVGKTEVARALASALNARLIRLQCYEGLDVSQAVYEWNYSRQLLHLRLLEVSGDLDRKEAERELFSEEFLIKRPLLQALEGGDAKVLLIDELDRADEEFEGYLLEMLSDFQITVPEVGTYTAESRPVVVITSNRTREVHDALKRRCLYYWIDYPDLDKETQIVRSKAPGASQRLAGQVTAFVQELRSAELYKVPGVAETLDWTAALVSLNTEQLTPEVIDETLGVMLKYREDVQNVRGEQTRALLARATNRGAGRGGRRG